MSKKLFYLYCFILLFGITAYTQAQVDAEIPRVDISPLIDGEMDHIWYKLQEHKIANAITATSSENDCSGSWWAFWNDQNIFIFVRAFL